LKKIANKLGVNVQTLVMGSGIVVLALIFLNIGAMLLSSVVGFLYPSYMSFKAIKTKDDEVHK